MGQSKPKRYSATLAPFTSEITNLDLSASLQGLVRFLGGKPLKLFDWDGDQLAISLTVAVELPPLGNFDGIDIRKQEPVLIVINLVNYPHVPPAVYPDRLDFPKDQLAHLYVTREGGPPAFCLIRGSKEEWYANKQLKDLVIRVSNWLRDAASGELTIDADQFDPIRLEGYWGMVIYDYDQLMDVVTQNKSYIPQSDFAIGLFERNQSQKGLIFKLNKIVTPANTKETFEEFQKEKEKDASLPSKKRYHFGYIVWSNHQTVFDRYEVNLPSDWERLKVFGAQFGIGLQNLEEWIATADANTYVTIPVIIGVKRPKPLIGFSGNIEFFNFCLRVDSPDVDDGKIVNNVSVFFQAHKQPLTQRRAREISGFKGSFGSYNLIIGCGALGSKITMHLARSGETNFILVDPDDLSPHNLARHAAPAGSVGLNKADALKNEINRIYPHEKLILTSTDKSGHYVLSAGDLLKVFNWIFDFTASNSFSQSLIKARVAGISRVCKCYLSDLGNLGILLLEGKDRNPRIDDLQVILYSQYRHMPSITEWLQRENRQEENNLSITVGVGCNSETIVLSDDVISLHSAYFAGVIKSESAHEAGEIGKIYLNQITQVPFYSNVCNLIKVPRLDVMPAVNDSSWQVRFQAGILEEIKQRMKESSPRETGGVMVGRANFKTRTIHVVEALAAPPDSQANEVCFFRGIEGLPDAIEQINTLSGNQLGYIGEWHSHPLGPNQPSQTDLNTVGKFKNYFEQLPTPLPVFLMIVTPNHILPYIF
ncbi:Mov34/MPN/PAD-1 family protein [Cytophagaceae bacterium YF14B1]|uniref:Mov34/MPN/PAD-1 family protein n=1 Tax=Xanthocytophaga flava TaxID=3048013 RepID=A0AAE3QVV5_9BACT|nr:ThiF family adenylyltransferase [Xanthocytophaga flavus]MDJ1485946.1 Mov34/MPN/PAD-1 family protein [Xanthocytophaga flavus]